ncbi:Pyrrolo-quinoline quinone beta-propeller repeat protein [Haloterrigena turkmenica DSM 5511]|uniref:Pyrrolo-quinoline quinone beta-propeller repeat protein n=1 Tax=Haloterrigena turkmenica (strain ATCC 51198 / DSM 5511 / JCM 9101 / NCIMB 13204 / VKM B-1734 / 4k) TaxID=543526 RepID=D2RPM7_HALTV|nr:PQQ-binding-like beta-propeller repeat protein [Haloterrigena turkmenica]ADB62179.1 Pyrrolo-quinoline quinone beta-propeller repeat protein [Haloterrigena turkmenica DSM 5511]
MEEWHRRSVLATGAALSAGGFASIGAGSEGDDAVDLPDPDVAPNPEMVDEDWPSFAGDAGHARFIEDGYEFNGDLEVAWTAAEGDLEWPHRIPSVAVADGTVYVTGPTTLAFEQGSFGVAAYDAADGSLRWKNDDINVSDPSVVGDTVYVTGEELFALDVADGSVRWQTEFDPEEPIETQTVAYGAVFVVVDGTLYALEADDGSVRWEIDSVATADEEDEYVFFTSVAAANGVVYTATEGITLSVEPETGAEVWRHETKSTSAQTRATTAAVALGRISFAERQIRDAQTGEHLKIGTAEYGDLTLGEEMYTGIGAQYLSAMSIKGEEYSWEIPILYDAGQPVISGETVYTYFEDESDGMSSWPKYSYELVALDKYEGTEKWAISNDDAPVGPICAISDETIYVVDDGDLVALREPADSEGEENGDDEREDEGSDDDGSADKSDDADDGRGDADDDGGSNNGDADNESSNGSDADDESSNGGDTGDTESSDGDSADEDGSDDDGNADSDGQTENRSTDAEDNDDTDGTPGFTAGVGLLGGALGLEWLRRRDDADEPAE